MPRKDLKNRTPVGSAMDNKIYYEMKAYSEKTGIPISKILDKGVIAIIKNNNPDINTLPNA